MTYLTYDDIFFYKGSKFLSKSKLSNIGFIESEIRIRIHELEPVECIQFLSFLNMVVYCSSMDELKRIFFSDLEYLKFHKKKLPDLTNKVYFSKLNILFLILKIFEGSHSGTRIITGRVDINASKLFGEALLLSNNVIELQEKGAVFFIMHFIRDFPNSYQKDVWINVYELRLKRYKEMYISFLHNYRDLKQASDKLFLKIGTSPEEYFDEIGRLIVWFGVLSNGKDKNIGFHNENMLSFYVSRENFNGSKLLNILDYFSKSLEDFRSDYISEKIRCESGSNASFLVGSYFAYLPGIYNKPVFKINEENFCIIDLAFLLEKACRGIAFELVDENHTYLSIAQHWGKIVEEKFSQTIESILPGISISANEESKTDAIFENHENIILFEFTTEFYTQKTLYSNDESLWYSDIDKILFNVGKTARKKDVGKFLKLHKYIDDHVKSAKSIFPVLVTERNIGDFDLINYKTNYLDKKILELGLTNLIKFKPIIISYDDIDLAHSNGITGDIFIKKLVNWSICTNKGDYHFNYGYFLTSQ